MFGLSGTVIGGFIVGVIAELILPRNENFGFVLTALLGIVGSVVATYAGQTMAGVKLARTPVVVQLARDLSLRSR